MIVKEFNTSSNKFIHLYDGLFSYIERSSFLEFLEHSLFLINGSDNGYSSVEKNQVFCNFNKDDTDRLNFFETQGFQELDKKYNFSNLEIMQVRVNASTFFENTVPHIDKRAITLLYFANFSWPLHYGGHTFFLDEEAKEVEYTATYKPGRVVVFDGSIPHLISPISSICRNYRFSFVIQYLKK